MRILFLSQVLPFPLDAGPKTRAYYVLRKLAAKHEVTLLSFTRPTDSEEAYDHLRKLVAKVITATMLRTQWREINALARSLIRNLPFLITRDRMKGMDEQIERILQEERFDAIHADQLWMAPYALKAAEISHSKGETPLLVLDQHNAVHLIPSRMGADIRNPLAKWLLRREARLMAKYESEICDRFDRVVWVTDEDRLAVRNIKVQKKRSNLIVQSPFEEPNLDKPGIRHDMVIPICIDPESIEPVSPLTFEPVILFVGGMHWPPNAEGVRWFADEVLPLIIEKVPKLKFLAVGKSPPVELSWIAEVEAPGFVEDLEPYWKQSRVFIVPLRAGGGMRVKILDAWAHGLPVVSTTIGAEGLEICSGENIVIAERSQDFAYAAIQLLEERNLGERLGEGGRQQVSRFYNWETVYHAWDEIYAQSTRDSADEMG